MGIRNGMTREQGDGGKLYVVCPDCGGPMSAYALLCRDCFYRAGGVGAAIYREAQLRGEASNRSDAKTDGTPRRAYHRAVKREPPNEKKD